MNKITTEDLRRMEGREALILQGCGEDLREWVDGINGLLTEEGILLNGSRFESVSVFQDGELTNLLFPFEGVELNAGRLAATVLDIVHNGMDIAILDASAACHMPDVLEMPYRPEIEGGGKPKEKPYTYRLGGNTCLAGDIIGDYSFDKPLKAGDKLFFKDMAIYSMVKNNTFNGIALPDICIYDGERAEVIKSFGYGDFKSRL